MPVVADKLSPARGALLPAALLGIGVVWSYWPTLTAMAERWWRDPQYSHGFLVPIFAAALLWLKRGQLANASWQPCGWGLLVLAAGMALHVVGAAFAIEALDAASLLPTLAGLVWLMGGSAVLVWAWPAIAFLGFMIPLPYFIEVALAHPLRRLATVVTTYTLQTIGITAIAEGNVILLENARLGVADACSGLGMLMTFFALATALAIVVRAPLSDRLVLVVSAVPIAVIANVARVTATGVAFSLLGPDSETAFALMHDLAGWLMMSFAFGLLWLETRLLARLFVETAESNPVPITQIPRAASNTDSRIS